MRPALRQFFTFAFLILLPGFGFFGEDKKPKRPDPGVTVAEAIEKTVEQYLDEIGNCTALESVNITPQVDGKIVKIHFTDGQQVKTGDPLFTIDPRPYEAALAKAEATLARNEATLTLNTLQLDRSKDLVPQDYLSPQDFDQLKTNVASSQADVAENKAEIEQAKINLEYCFIKSPIDGKAGVRQVDVGNVVTATGQTDLLSIQRIDPIYVDFTVTEGKLNLVRKYEELTDLSVLVSTPEETDNARPAKMYFVDNSVDTATGTVLLRAIMENRDRRFWPGQFVRARILLRPIPRAILIPQGAVQISQSGPFAYVINSQEQAEKRNIKQGQRYDKWVVIEEGIKPGEKVVTTGQLMLKPGVKVNVVKSKPPEPPKPSMSAGASANTLLPQPGNAVNVQLPEHLTNPRTKKQIIGPQPPPKSSDDSKPQGP